MRRRRLRNASDVEQDRPRSTQESRGLTRTIRATIAYHQGVRISVVAIVYAIACLTLNISNWCLSFICVAPLSSISPSMPATQFFDRQL
jgi:hypothetical protein